MFGSEAKEARCREQMRPELSASSTSRSRLLRPAPVGFPLRHPLGVALGAAHRQGSRTSSSTSASRRCSWASSGRASCTSSPTAISGTTCTSAPTVAGRLAQSRRPSCCPGYDGAWDAAPGVCHPKRSRLLRVGEVLGGRPHVLRRLHRAASGRPGTSCGAIASRSGRPPTWPASSCPSASPSAAWAACSRAAASACEPTRSVALAFPAAQPGERVAVQGGESSHSQHMCRSPVHPTQIYESAVSLAIAAICLVLGAPAQALRRSGVRRVRRALRGGALPARVLARDDRGELLGLSTSQLIGVGLVAAVVVLHRYLARGSAPAPVTA